MAIYTSSPLIPRENYLNHGHNLEAPLLEKETKGSSFTRTCFNGLNTLLGVGILSVSYALSEGGWSSLLLLLLIAIICCYTGFLLQRCMLAKPGIRTYPDIAELAFGTAGRVAVSTFLYLELYLVAIEFLILGGDNLAKLLPDWSLDLGVVRLRGGRLFTAGVALVVLPTTWLSNLDMLAVLSAGGVVTSVVVVASVMWVGVFDSVGFHGEGSEWFDLAGLPMSLSMYTFCYCGHALFPTLISSMHNKRDFPKVLLLCFIVCTLNYGSMAVIGYLMYGSSLQSQITLNLPMGKIASYVAIAMALSNPLTKYALVITPIAEAIEEKFLLGRKTFASFMVRTSIVVTTLAVGISIPFFAYIMAFIGSSASVVVSIILPCLCYLKISKTTPKCKIEKVVLVLVMIVGAFVGVVGTYSSIRQIARSL